MQNELIVAAMPIHGTNARITVFLQDQQPVEIYCEDPSVGHLRPGNIYIGKVEQIDPRLHAAFVRVAPKERVYLPLDPDDAVHAGDEIAVQIVQESLKTKLPKASLAIERSGEYMVLSTRGNGVSFSRKLSSAQKEELREWLRSCPPVQGRILLRTRAGDASPGALTQELEELQHSLEEIRTHARTRTLYSVLYRAPLLQEQLLQRLPAGSWKRLQTDDPQIREQLQPCCAARACPLEWYTDPALALYHLHDLSAVLDKALRREITLPSGASLVLEQTEAFVAIDVNSARFAGKKSAKEVRARVNREAAKEAARQIRLRQLSGAILIDFMNSETEEEKELAALLQNAFLQDPVPTHVIDFTKLHICEITRKKVVRSLREQIAMLRETGTEG